MLACIISNGLSVLVFLLIVLLFGIPPSSDQFCTVVWHQGLRKYQTETIEAIHRRASRIIYPVTVSMPYWVALQYLSLSDRRDTLHCRDFFRKLLHPSNCIHHLLPPPRVTEKGTRFWKPYVVLLIGFPKPGSFCTTGFPVWGKIKTGFRVRLCKSRNCVHCKSTELEVGGWHCSLVYMHEL